MNLGMVLYALAALASLSGFIHLFTGRYRTGSIWLRIALFTTSAAAAVWAALGIFLALQGAKFTPERLWSLEHIKTGLGGLLIGMSVMVLTSPEYRRIRRSESRL
jgi:hypothetical protein